MRMTRPVFVPVGFTALLLAHLLGGCETSEAAKADTSSDSVAPADGNETDTVESDSGPSEEVDTSVEPPHPALEGTEPATFTVRPGVEIVTVFDATPGNPVTLYDRDGTRLLSVIADAFGQAHFAYLPPTHETIDPTQAVSGEIVKRGRTVAPGPGYLVRDDSVTPPRASTAFRVLAVSDVAPTAHYDKQSLEGIVYGVLGPADGVDVQEGLNYIEMRDGVRLSAMVRFPDPLLWGEGPYPTVVEYSGYSPSDPGAPDPGSRIATLLGYATVGVNMRGTGCSGGVFDIFSPAQHADGYDIVEVVARQSWVLHNHVGMVGLSYPGISQLYVAYTNPPSLAAVTPLSVLADPWQELRPGGIYNDGFTRQWLEQRDAEASPNGQSWTDARIAWGDTACAEHQELRNQNLEFEVIFQELEFYPADAAARSLPNLVSEIECPVYLTGAFQDEQTGPQFADMLNHFDNAAVRRFTLYNGRHPDGYSPLVLLRWWEFLELYVAKRVPRLPGWVRSLGAAEFSKEYDSTDLTFEPDRFDAFTDDDYAGALAFYEAEPDVRVLFESGGGEDQPGAPVARFETSLTSWPPPDAATQTFFLDAEERLVATAPAAGGVDTFEYDPAAGAKTFFGTRGYWAQQMTRLWEVDWTDFAEGKVLSYLTEPLATTLVSAGPAYVEVHLTSDVGDVVLQATISEVRPDGNEYLVTSGWLRAGHRERDDVFSYGNHVAYTFAEDTFEPLDAGEEVVARIPIPSFAHTFRAGSRLRLTIATPGRNHGTWEFLAPSYGQAVPSHRIARGGAKSSALVLTTFADPDTLGIPAAYPACPGLRGQPCRPFVPKVNLEAVTTE